MTKQVKSGTVTGTGAAIDISLGWNPKRVVVLNTTSATLEQLEWITGMDDGAAIKTVAAGTRTKIASTGISAFAGDDDEALGFTIGADTDVNVSAEEISWIAYRD